MPSDAKFSPSFHEVRPAMVPLHSFCQILFPILSASLCETVTATRVCNPVQIDVTAARERRTRVRRFCRQRCSLDESRLSISVPPPAALNLNNPRGKYHFMKHLILILAAGSLALPLFGQEKSP